MEIVNRCLKDDGIAFIHTIGRNTSSIVVNRWIDKYIFPNGMLPSIAQIGAAMEDLFVMEDWHNFGPDYDTTLMAWYRNFEQAWPQLQAKYDERFYRMWRFLSPELRRSVPVAQPAALADCYDQTRPAASRIVASTKNKI